MDKKQAQEKIESTFESPFDKDRFASFIRNLLNYIDESKAFHARGEVKEMFKHIIKTYERLGTYTDPDGKKVDIIIAYLQKGHSLDHARVTQRNFAAKYLSDRGEKEAGLFAFVSPDEEDWRFSLVKMDYRFEEGKDGKVKVKEEFTPARRWSFLVGANEKSHTAKRQLVPIIADDEHNPTLAQLEEAFNIEKATREFFEKYRDLFLWTKETLDDVVAKHSKIKADFEAKGVNTVDFAKKLLGQIVFLYFLQKKGWFGVERDKAWGTGSKRFLRDLFDGRIIEYKNFFNDVLEPLFYDALARDRSDVGHFNPLFKCKIPFLNGGLFDPINSYDWAYTDILLPNKLFSNTIKTKEGDIGNGILDIFDRFNFTVKEDEPLEKEVAIDPELLGKAYEKFNAIRPDNYEEYKKALKSGKKGAENKFNRQYGVYYTPREIVHYMCQQSLINYLATELEGKVRKEAIEFLILKGEEYVEYLKIAKEKKDEGKKSKRYRENEYFIEIKKYAQAMDDSLSSIKVCDPAIGSGAFPVGMMTEIIKARLFFSETKCLSHLYRNIQGDEVQRKAYNYKRECIENSLYGVDIDPGAVEIAKLRLWLSLIVDEDDFKHIRPLPNLDYKIVCGNSLLDFPDGVVKNVEIEHQIEELKRDYFNETNVTTKRELRTEIDNKFRYLVEEAKQYSDRAIDVTFDFEVYFSEVFHEKGGFDIAIANPPYNAKLTKAEREVFKRKFQCVRSGRQDTAAIFVELAQRIGTSKMVLTYILPYRLFSRKRNHGQFQVYTLNNFSIRTVIYLGSDIGFSTSDEFMILIMSSGFDENNTINIAFKPDLERLDDRPVFSSLAQSVLRERSEVNLNLTRFKAPLLAKIEKQTLPLEIICHIKDGIVPFIREKLLADMKIDERYVRFAGIAGKYVLQKYWFSYDELYLCYDTSEAKKYIKDKNELRKVQLREREIFLNRKIVTAQNSATLKGCIDENKIFVSNSLHSTYLREDYRDKFALEYILALINSKLINYYHDSLRLKATDLHPQILIKNLKRLPIKNISLREQIPFVSLVHRITTTNESYSDWSTPMRKAEVEKAEREIDQLVYELYELNDEEVSIVEER